MLDKRLILNPGDIDALLTMVETCYDNNQAIDAAHFLGALIVLELDSSQKEVAMTWARKLGHKEALDYLLSV